MDTKEIQTRLNGLLAAMVAKGLKRPSADFTAEAAVTGFRIYMRWDDPTKVNGRSYSPSNDLYEFVRDEDAKKVFDKADKVIAAMPTAEEARLKQFMGALGAVIDLGKENGVEVEFLNPLQATMKKLSDNILTDQRAA